jgi:hypothetical protein
MGNTLVGKLVLNVSPLTPEHGNLLLNMNGLDPHDVGDLIGNVLAAGNATHNVSLAVHDGLGKTGTTRQAARTAVGTRQNLLDHLDTAIDLHEEYARGDEEAYAEEETQRSKYDNRLNHIIPEPAQRIP